MKLDRLMGILIVLLKNERISAPVLAEKFEVSRRTISRDIEALCKAGIPIVTRQGGNGGISILEGYRLDKSVLTQDELSTLVIAMKGLGTVTQDTAVQRMLEKLSPGRDAVVSLKESVVIDLASHYKGSLTEKIHKIKRAIQEERLITFNYFYEKGESSRCIEPYFISFQWMAWYVFGFCLERQDWRLFKLSRLWNLELAEAGFVPRDIPPEKRDFSGGFTDHLKLVALFEPSVKYQLIDSYGPCSFTETEDGMLRLEVGFTNKGYTLSWILSFGDKVKVLEPPTLAEEVKQIARSMAARYEQL